jgi:hypothetical protein
MKERRKEARQEMVSTLNPRRHGATRIDQRVVMHRKATNFEIMRDAFEKYGNVTINISLKIKSANPSSFAGFNGTGITVVAPSVEVAEKFPEALRNAIAKIAQEFNMTAKRKDSPL